MFLIPLLLTLSCALKEIKRSLRCIIYHRLFFIILIKAADIFTEPYQSRLMGWVRVWDLHILRRDVWSADDVVSKCYIFPTDRLQQDTTKHNPLPDIMRLKPEDDERRLRLFNSRFSQLDRMGRGTSCSWYILPLLQVPGSTFNKMVRNHSTD